MIRSLIISSWVFVVSFLLTMAFKLFAPKLRLLDIPNNRSSHSQPVPRGAGITFLISFCLGLGLLYSFRLIPGHVLLTLMGGGSLVAFVGFLDDFSHVPAFIRVLVHTMAALWVLSLYHVFAPLNLGFINWTWNWEWFSIVICLLGVVWMVNLYNFMDGLDGLAGSEAVFVLLSATLLMVLKGSGELVPINLVSLAAIAGFLYWNWSPAHVFMGDSGSGFLGFIFGALVVISYAQGIFMPWTWLILLGCFWIDATFTLVRRMIRRETWYAAHRSHAFQHATNLLGSHKKVVLSIMGINICWLLPLAALSVYLPNWGFALTVIANTPLVILWAKLKGGITKIND